MSSRPNRRYDQIGLDRLVRLKWLERTAYLFLAGNDAPAVKAALQEDLQGAFRSKNTKIRGSLDKTITILMRIWVRPPRDREGLKLLSHLPREDHIAVHWGMAMAVYPFWGAVAAHVGRLLRLQGTAAASQVQRRVREQYGERDTVSRAARRVLRSFVDWEVLKETSEKGIYTAGLSLAIAQVELIAWLAEAFLHAHPNGSVALRTVLDSTSLFPFRLSPISTAHLVAVSGRLDVLRHGLDQDLIMLRTESLPALR
jgi:Holliday junction resolvase-like predicted endonuclease